MLFNIYIQEENENGEIVKPFEYQCTKSFLDTREAKRTEKSKNKRFKFKVIRTKQDIIPISQIRILYQNNPIIPKNSYV